MRASQEGIDVNICLEPDLLAIFAFLLVPAILLGLKRNRNAAAWKLMIPLAALVGTSYLFTALFGATQPLVRQFLTIVRVFYIGTFSALAALTEDDRAGTQALKASGVFLFATFVSFVSLTAYENVGLFAAIILGALAITTLGHGTTWSLLHGRVGRVALLLMLQIPGVLAAVCMGPVLHIVYARTGSIGSSDFISFSFIVGILLNALTALLLTPLLIFAQFNPTYGDRLASLSFSRSQPETTCVPAG